MPAPAITKANMQAFFSTARTKEEAAKHFGFSFDKPTDSRHADRFHTLFCGLLNKEFFQALVNKQFLTIKGPYVGYNSRVAAEDCVD